MVAVHTQPTFLYPKSRQFPFDEVCEQIVRALEERNWDVPGITVEFDDHGTGDEKYKMVRYIRGEDFKLWFCRVQGRLNYNLNDTAAITEIAIPKKELHVYDEESGPTLYVYTGKNWKKDKERFLNGSKLYSKRRKEPRWYLKYKGACNCRATAGASFEATGFIGALMSNDSGALSKMYHTHQGQRSELLVPDNDLGREYEPKRGEPKQYRTWDVFNEFTLWLKKNLLARILEEPVAKEKVDACAVESSTPFPAHLGPIFCLGENQDAERVYKGRKDPTELEPSDRYALMGSGWRLLSLGTRNDGSVPEVAYEGFLWAGLDEITDNTAINAAKIPGSRQSDQERFLFKVTPNQADGIYVADNAPYEQHRKALSDEIESTEPERKQFTDAEIGDFNRARARTIIPIAEYDGSFEQPIVLINRELDFDEVELVSGPWPEYQYVKQIIARSPKVRELFEQAMLAHKGRYQDYRDKTRQAMYDRALKRLIAPFRSDQEFAASIKAYEKETFRRTELDGFMERLLGAGREMQELGLL